MNDPNYIHFTGPAHVGIICCQCGVSEEHVTYELEDLGNKKVQPTGRMLCDRCLDNRILNGIYAKLGHEAFGGNRRLAPRDRR